MKKIAIIAGIAGLWGMAAILFTYGGGQAPLPADGSADKKVDASMQIDVKLDSRPVPPDVLASDRASTERESR